MKSILLLLLFLTPILGFSQYYPDKNSYCQIEPYYDYSLCLKGIKDENGLLVLAPRFTEITKLPNDMILVIEGGLYGVLNCEFEVVVPIIYKRLQWMPNETGLEKYTTNYSWIFETDDGSGLMNSSLEIIIPPIYDHIERMYAPFLSGALGYHRRFNGPTEEKSGFYKVLLDHEYGLLNEFGEQILPVAFRSITYYRLHDSPSTRTLPTGFYFQAFSDSTQSFYSEKGVQLNEESVKINMELFSSNSSTIIKTEDSRFNSKAICLESGRTIKKEYSDIAPSNFCIIQYIGDYSSFRVYNSNLEEIYSDGKVLKGLQKIECLDRTYVKLIDQGNKNTLFSQNGEIILPTTNDDILLKRGDSTEFLWTVPTLSKRRKGTLRTYFIDGNLKQKFVIKGLEGAYFFHQKGTNGGVDLFDPLLFIKKRKKWGALDRSGDLKLSFKYDSPGTPFYSEKMHNGRTIETHDGYLLKKRGKTGAIDSLGAELFPCKYDSLVVNFADNLSLTKKKGNYSLVDQHVEKIYLSNCDDLFNGDFFLLSDQFSDKETSYGLSEHDDKTSYAFGVRNKTLVTLIDREERVCDSTVLDFTEPLLLVDHVLVDKRGQIVLDVKDGILRKTKRFYLHISDNVAQVIQFSGEKGLQINDFEAAQIEGDYVKVKLNDQTMGVISLNGKNWLYRPKYYDITFTNFPPTHAWVNEDTMHVETYYGRRSLKTYEGRWMLVDTSYKKLYDFPFKIPLNVISQSRARFESEHQFGMLNSSLKLIFPPKYDYLYQLENSNYVLLYTDSVWKLGHNSGDVDKNSFNSISHLPINNNVAVFTFTESDTLIGIIRYNKKFESIVPMTEMNELIATSWLDTLLDVGNGLFSYCLNNYDHSVSHWRIQSNQLIVNYLLNNQCHIRNLGQRLTVFSADFEFQDLRYLGVKKSFYEEVKYRNTNTIEIKSEYPEELKEFHEMSNHPNCLRLVFNTPQLLTMSKKLSCYSSYGLRTFDNYIYLDTVEKIELNDILLKNDKTSGFLRDFVVRKFTEGQLGGESCPDLEKTEALMWSSFYFNDGGIGFSDINLILTYNELKPYLTEKGKRLNPW